MKKALKKFLAFAMVCITILSLSVSAFAATSTTALTGFYWPLETNKTITSGFGVWRSSSSNYHQGIDISASTGTAIYAAKAGTVKAVGYDKISMGYYVCISHGTLSNGKELRTTYMHMNKWPSVKKGQTVTVNTVIGYVGSTGNSTGAHLHFQIFQCSKSSGSVSPSHKTKSQLNTSYYNPDPKAGVIQYTYRSDTTPTSNTTKAALTINLTSYPTSITKGNSFGLKGTISSGYKITKVQGYVVNSSGKTVLSSTDTPNSTSLNIQTAKLNSKLTFNTLSAGTYTLKIVATDAGGRTKTVTKSFTVVKSTLKINLTSYPSSIKKGSSYGLRGTVSSNVKVTKVQGYVINSKGKTVLSSTDTPNSTSMNIKTAKLNSKLTFNTLAAGTYTLKIVATDASGNSVTWSKTFKVTK